MSENHKNSRHDRGTDEEIRALSFICPKCGHDKLCHRETVVIEVLYVASDGDFELGEELNSEERGFSCAQCGYVPEDERGVVNSGEHLAAWLIAHCRQET